MPPVLKPAYRYGFLITQIYDADTIIGHLDLYDHIWKRAEPIRLYGINANEIRRSAAKNIDAAHVDVGYDHRDELIRLLGLDVSDFPRKCRYHVLREPVRTVVETVKDRSGKFGRLLGIVHKDGVNVNEALRDVIGGVEFYDGWAYPPDYPIRPPD